MLVRLHFLLNYLLNSVPAGVAIGVGSRMANTSNMAHARAKYEAAHHELVESIKKELEGASYRQLLLVSAVLVNGGLPATHAGQAGASLTQARGGVPSLSGGPLLGVDSLSGGSFSDEASPEAGPFRQGTGQVRMKRSEIAELAALAVRAMGSEELKLSQVTERIRDRLPEVKSEGSYVGHLLRSRPEFEQVRHGVYRVKGTSGPGKGPAGGPTLETVWKLLSKHSQEQATAGWVADQMGCANGSQVSGILGALGKRGWLEKTEDGYWRMTREGRKHVVK